MTLAWTPEAVADRRAIYAYIDADNPSAAVVMDEAFTDRTAQLLTHPMIGRPGRVESTRELVVQHNYLLIYDVSGSMVRILRILHAAQRWPEEKL